MAHLDAETTLQYFYYTAGCVHIIRKYGLLQMPKKDTPDYKVMQFQGEVRSPHMYEEKNRS